MPFTIAARSKAWVCCRSFAGMAVSNPAGSMDVCFECCVLSGRGLCDGLITRPDESHQVCVCVCVCVCVSEFDRWPIRGCRAMKIQKKSVAYRDQNHY